MPRSKKIISASQAREETRASDLGKLLSRLGDENQPANFNGTVLILGEGRNSASVFYRGEMLIISSKSDTVTSYNFRGINDKKQEIFAMHVSVDNPARWVFHNDDSSQLAYLGRTYVGALLSRKSSINAGTNSEIRLYPI